MVEHADGCVTHLIALVRNLIILGGGAALYFYRNPESWQWFLELSIIYRILIAFGFLFIVNALTVLLIELKKYLTSRS